MPQDGSVDNEASRIQGPTEASNTYVVDGLQIPPQTRGESERLSKEFLNLPLIPSRPSTPGTLSVISQDEWNGLDKIVSVRDPGTWRLAIAAFWVRNLGLLYMLLAQIFGTAMNVAVRTLEVEGNNGRGLHPFQILFVRMAITVVLSCTYMAYTNTPYFPLGMPEVRPLLVVRGLGGFFGVFGMYFSLRYLPVADATVLTYLAPGLACWVCSLLIAETFTRTDKIGTFVSLCGVVFIARPASLLSFAKHDTSTTAGVNTTNGTVVATHSSKFDAVSPEQHVRAVLLGLVGVCGAVSAIVTIRWIGKRAHPLISTNYFAAWCTIVTFVMQLILPDVGFILPANAREWGLLLFLGVCGFIMQFCLAAGLSYEKSHRATNMTYTSMLFALASDKIFFNQSPGISSIMGSILILGAAIVMALQKSQPAAAQDEATGRPEESRGLMQDVEREAVIVDDPVPMRELNSRL